MVALTEIAGELGEQGIENVFNPNFGGTVTFDWGWVKLVPAWHTSTTPNGTVTPPAGLLIHIGGTLVYHLGDTALFSDLQLISRRGDKVDVALVPIGGHFTMDRHDAVTAVEFINPGTVIPVHYDTMPAIETDAEAFKADVESQTERPGRHPAAGGDAFRVTHAIVLIEAERSAMPTLGGQLADVEGVAEAYSVTGEWDFVAIMRVREPDELAPLITGPARPDRRASSARTRWSRSRSSPSTTWRRCSRSATSGAGAARGRPGGVRGEDRAVRAAAEGGAVAGGRRGRRGADPPARGDHRRARGDQAGAACRSTRSSASA